MRNRVPPAHQPPARQLNRPGLELELASVPDLLSEEWFEALAASLNGLPVHPDGAGERSAGLSLGQIVTGVPEDAGAAGVQDGEVRYTIVLRPEGSASLVRDSVAPANVILVEEWSTAEAIASGETSVPDLLTAGRIKVRGDSRALVVAGDLLARVAPLVAAALGGKQGE
jgi:hypothetical protein